MISGIYAIDGPDGFRYVGKSQNIIERWYKHLISLDAGSTHTNTDISLVWKKYGPTVFTFRILEVCSFADLDKKEQEWIDRWPLEKQYNGPSKEKPSRNKGYVKLSDGQIFKNQSHFAAACGYVSPSGVDAALSRGSTYDDIAKRRGLYLGSSSKERKPFEYLSDTDRLEIVKYYTESRYTQSSIAEIFNVSRVSIYRTLKQHGVLHARSGG